MVGKLGSGSFATVYKARRLSDQQIYAIKKVTQILFRFLSLLLMISPKAIHSIKSDCLLPSTLLTSSSTTKPSWMKNHPPFIL